MSPGFLGTCLVLLPKSATVAVTVADERAACKMVDRSMDGTHNKLGTVLAAAVEVEPCGCHPRHETLAEETSVSGAESGG